MRDIFIGACVGSVFACAMLLLSCASTPTPAQQADVAAYQADQLVCVVAYSTKESIDKCRDEVRARHGRKDAGNE